jgi:hypothetical protein
MPQFKTLHFANTPSGQHQKNQALAKETAAGWKIVSETITPGKFKGGNACCLFLIFAPCAFFAGSTDGTINVTLQHDGEPLFPSAVSTPPSPAGNTPPIGGKKGFFILLSILSFGLFMSGIGRLFTNVLVGVELILLGILCFPSLSKVLRNRFRFELPIAGQVALFVLIFSASIMTATSDYRSNSSSSPQAQTSAPKTSSVSANVGSASSSDEKQYLRSAVTFLTRQNDIGSTVAKAMNGLNSGDSTLQDVHAVLQKARADNEAAWESNLGGTKVPSLFLTVGKKIRKSFDMRQLAYKRYLKYWSDGGLDHIPKASKIFFQSEALAQEATKDLTPISNSLGGP